MNTSIMSTAVPPPPKAHTGHDSVNATDESIPAFAGMTPATRSGITSARIERVFFKLLILLLSVYKPAREEDHPLLNQDFRFVLVILVPQFGITVTYSWGLRQQRAAGLL